MQNTVWLAYWLSIESGKSPQSWLHIIEIKKWPDMKDDPIYYP